jgi:hypothetical protein
LEATALMLTTFSVKGRNMATAEYISTSNNQQSPSVLTTGKVSRREWLRFLQHIDLGDWCHKHNGPPHRHWLWRCPSGNGYGYFFWRGRRYKATRFAWVALKGPIPPSLELDHLCRIPACTIPECVEPVTRRENLLRGENRSAQLAHRTHCARGHLYDVQNTLFRKNSGRACRRCHADESVNRRKRLRSAKHDS